MEKANIKDSLINNDERMEEEKMGDQDVDIHKSLNECCDENCIHCWKNCCTNFYNCLCCIGRFLRDVIWNFLWVVLFRPVFHAVCKCIARIPDAIGGIINPGFLLVDVIACCETDGGKGWPAFSVASRALEGGILITGCKSILPVKQRSLGRRAVFFGVFWAVYFCMQLIDITEHCFSVDSKTVIVPRLNPFHYLSVDGRIRNMNPGFMPLLILACYWAVTVGWLWGKMSILKWIPEALEKTQENIRIASLKRHHKNFKERGSSIDRQRQFKISKLELWSHYFELILSLPSSVLGLLWDTMHQVTLIKAWCGNNSYVKRGRKSVDSCCSVCCHNFCHNVVMDVHGAADEHYNTVLARKALEFNRFSITAKNYIRGTTDKRSYLELELERLQVEQYLKDVANNSVSDPVMPSKNIHPPSIANWKNVAEKNSQVQQLWSLHSCEGFPIAKIAACYNHTLYSIRNDLMLPLMLPLVNRDSEV